MSARSSTMLRAALLASAALLPISAVRADRPEGIEVLTRGPVHEAFAEPGVTPQSPQPVVPQRPPDPVNEIPPDQKPEGPDVEWIPGYWTWDVERGEFVWLSGFWRTPPPGRDWVPGHWQQAEGGWQWVPGFWAEAGQGEVDYLPRPPEPPDEGPSVPPPDDQSVYAPGVWVYRQARYWWRPGCWIEPRPGCVWVPAHYAWTPCGYVFVEGYWDYPLGRRGLLFPPVVIARSLLAQPGWCYVPRYAVYDDYLQSCLFVRPRYGSYYFGNYFGPRYARLGLVPWPDYRPFRSGYDPLFSYYRHRHAGDRGWERDLRGLYAARAEGRVPPPPRTRAVASLDQLGRDGMRLGPVGREQLARQRERADLLRETVLRRQQLEARFLPEGPARANEKPRQLKLALPAAPRPDRGDASPPPPPPRREPVSPHGHKEPSAPPQPRRDAAQFRHEVHQPEPIAPRRDAHPDRAPSPPPRHEAHHQPPPRREAMPLRHDAHPPEPPAHHRDRSPAPRHDAQPQPPPRHEERHAAPPAPPRHESHRQPTPPHHDAPAKQGKDKKK